MSTSAIDQYDQSADGYELIASLPLLKLEHELTVAALSSSACAGARVFDLGGGSGVQARLAIAAGASVVDVVDISKEMLRVGAAVEQQEGREGRINYLLGDATKPLDHLGLKKQSYDIVIANWLFVHSETMADLEGMWANIADYIKPGGRFIGIRVNEPDSVPSRSGKYGVIHDTFKDIPGGLSLRVFCKTDPPTIFWCTNMKPSLFKSTELDEKYGFQEIKFDCGENSELIKKDPDFWEEWFQGPFMTMVTSVKG